MASSYQYTTLQTNGQRGLWRLEADLLRDHGNPIRVPWLAYDQISGTGDEDCNRTREEQVRSMVEEVLMSDIWLPFIPQVLVQLLCPVHSKGVCGGIGVRIVFGVSATRMMTYTLVAAAWRSSLIWKQGDLRSRPALSAAEASPLASRACGSASPRPVLRVPKERRRTCRRCTGRSPSRPQLVALNEILPG